MESATVSTFVTLVNGILSMSTSSKWSIDDLLLLACFHLSLSHDSSSIRHYRHYRSDDTIYTVYTHHQRRKETRAAAELVRVWLRKHVAPHLNSTTFPALTLVACRYECQKGKVDSNHGCHPGGQGESYMVHLQSNLLTQPFRLFLCANQRLGGPGVP